MRKSLRMTAFDKVCALLSILLGVIFMILGLIGFFAGARAHFTLPPIFGGLPFFVGWGMCVPLVKYWKLSLENDTGTGGDEI